MNEGIMGNLMEIQIAYRMNNAGLEIITGNILEFRQYAGIGARMIWAGNYHREYTGIQTACRNRCKDDLGWKLSQGIYWSSGNMQESVKLLF